jgi:predicted phosphoribosyltransferase
VRGEAGILIFRDRPEAGRFLAEQLAPPRDDQPVVSTLPRGGIPVAAEVACSVGGFFDVVVVHKLGLPSQSELEFGAIGEIGSRLPAVTAWIRRQPDVAPLPGG